MGDVPAELLRMRATIDNLDAAIIHLLAERFKCTESVGRLKAARGMPPADPGREQAQMERLQALAVESGLDPEFARKYLELILADVIRHHERHIAGAQAGAAENGTAG